MRWFFFLPHRPWDLSTKYAHSCSIEHEICVFFIYRLFIFGRTVKSPSLHHVMSTRHACGILFDTDGCWQQYPTTNNILQLFTDLGRLIFIRDTTLLFIQDTNKPVVAVVIDDRDEKLFATMIGISTYFHVWRNYPLDLRVTVWV